MTPTGAPVAKKVAVLVTDRQEEALRMSLGLLLLGDVVDVYVLGRPLEPSARTRLHLETMKEFDVAVYTDCAANADLTLLPADSVAERLLAYDHVLPY